MDLQQLISKCKSNNQKAQEELYHYYKEVLFSLSLKYCRNFEEAQDNLHNTFIEIFSNISQYKGNGSFEGWMKRIAINKAIDSYKKTFQLSPITKDFHDDFQVDDADFETVSLDKLLSYIQELPNQYRLVFCLYELDDYSHREIAEMLSISESTSKSNLHRAKIILKEKIITTKSTKNYKIGNGK
ncbi:sigma-70 family RNA polymerase sigma factor [Flavobacterium sp. SM15]|uniref:RNA polymerase sigma factor n=1 Tax=Flavobacterium sp. SM15 TaxID=2908005 RepID=UPI001EDA8F95|nr:sigma-70 family RNA polymerase sigma factor [Flavobacterium sp. SM15]MCG2610690.1 sigma-70 family RNA polymerase sigma factor [Flavobacterium sp. SM15]